MAYLGARCWPCLRWWFGGTLQHPGPRPVRYQVMASGRPVCLAPAFPAPPKRHSQLFVCEDSGNLS
jgi:hypothetical protein